MRSASRLARRLRAGAIAASLLAALGADSCTSEVDYYSQVAPHCMQPVPDLGHYFSNPVLLSYIEPGCKEALLSILPLELDTFEKAAPGYLDKILEAFQAIIAYPLLIPEANEILGKAPEKAGAIPYDFYRIYRESGWDNPNQALFNYMVSRFKTIRYAKGEKSGSGATCTPTKDGFCTLTVYRKFWDILDDEDDPEDDGDSVAEHRLRNPFLRAGTLAHEARHGDGYMHSYCGLGESSDSGFECDHELSGPIGFGIAYYRFLLHGGATCEEPRFGRGCKAPLTPMIIRIVGATMCHNLKERILGLYSELNDLLEQTDCGYITYDWVMEHESIPYPPESLFPEDHPDELAPDPAPSPSPQGPVVSQG